jgi:FdrA protein
MAFMATVRKNQYHDSVRLMNISRQASSLDGVNSVLALLGTEGNKKVLKDLGLFNQAVESSSPNDLVICVDTDSEDGFKDALEEVDRLLKEAVRGSSKERKAQSLDEAVDELPDANFALISVPGEFAVLEVMTAIEHGLHIMLFSDNISIEDELFLKKMAVKKGLLMMGPDCGTAIINGVPLAFANVVRRGDVGIIGASGTGIQEVSCLLHRLGGGVSHAIGVGGRDLSEQIGGMMMVMAIRKLAEDPATRSFVLISKPGALGSTRRVLKEARKCGLPVIVCLLGSGELPDSGRGITFVNTLEDAAFASVGKDKPESVLSTEILEHVKKMPKTRKRLCGLFSGGTLCYEALLVFDGILKVHSNITNSRNRGGKITRQGHYCLDLGDDEFTQGRPHPMIDSTLRQEYLIEAYTDPSTMIILLDVVLGYGSNADPAGDIVSALKEARSKAGGFGPIVLAHVCGTEGDPQSMDEQESRLKEAGVYLFPTNAEAARAASAFVGKR